MYIYSGMCFYSGVCGTCIVKTYGKLKSAIDFHIIQLVAEMEPSLPEEECPQLRETATRMAAEIDDTEISEPDFGDCNAVYYVAGQ